jgi:putative transposase
MDAMELYHVLNRGVEKRSVVLDDEDRVRFLHDLFVFNDTKAAPNYILPGRQMTGPRTLLIHLHAFCLMDNHYHLLLSEAREGGIGLFLQKLNMGYAKYFNEKYKRTGVLWQGPSKKILIARDAHFLHIPFYIHLNPLDYSMPEWRKGAVRNAKKALAELATYRWSSHLDYLGVKNFPSLTEREFLGEVLGGKKRYEKEMCDIIADPQVAAESAILEFRSD